MQDWLVKYPDLSMVYGLSDTISVPALTVAAAAEPPVHAAEGLDDEPNCIMFVSVDGIFLNEVAKGRLFSTELYSPYWTGYAFSKFAVALAKGAKVSKSNMVDSMLVTPVERRVRDEDGERHAEQAQDLPVRRVAPDDREDEVQLHRSRREHVGRQSAPLAAATRRREAQLTRRGNDACPRPPRRCSVLSEMTKRFPGTLALDGIDLVVERGTIHGLVGENGAGKSTLLKILAGDYKPTSGRIEIDGEEVEIATPRRAHELGIGIVYQELSLLTNLSVAHNISLGNEPTNALAVDERRLTETAREVLVPHGRALGRPDAEGRQDPARRAPARRDREGADAAPAARS